MPTDTAQATPDAPQSDDERIAFRNTEIQRWRAWQAALADAKQGEMAARVAVTGLCFPNPSKGTQRVDLGGGAKLKLVYKYNYTLGDKEKKHQDGTEYSVYDQVSDLEERCIKAFPPNSRERVEAEMLIERLIKWTPDISESEYKKLEATPTGQKIKKLVDEVLTIKPAAPSLEFEEPKEPKL